MSASCRLANALMGLGLSKGDRVCVLAYNCVEWLEIYAATALAGLVAVPINFRLRRSGDPLHRRELRGRRAHRPGPIDRCDRVGPRRYASRRADKFIVFGGDRRHAGYRAYEDLIASRKRSPAVREP